MKKALSILLTICMLFTTFVGCATTTTTPAASIETPASTDETVANGEPLQVVTTIFPLYDWTKSVLGDTEGVELSLLIDTGVDVHSYQPSTDDIIQIAQCDMFIYVGGESDQWVEDALKNAMNPDMIVLNLMEILGDDAKVEELVEGMEAHVHDHEEEADHDHEEEADHDDDEADHDHDEEEAELDEHIWLSLTNAAVLTEAITQALSAMNPVQATAYSENIAAYLAELSQLDEEYATVAANGKVDTLLVADRFPFRYLVDDYDLAYYAAFAGCSAETEASFETITFLATKLDELGLPVVLTIEGSDGKIAQTVVDATTAQNYTILTLDSMQAVTAADIEAGASYLAIMATNLTVLEEALG